MLLLKVASPRAFIRDSLVKVIFHFFFLLFFLCMVKEFKILNVYFSQISDLLYEIMMVNKLEPNQQTNPTNRATRKH